MKKTKRIISFILAFVLVLSSVNVVSAYEPNNSNTTGTATGSGAGTVSGNFSLPIKMNQTFKYKFPSSICA